MSPARATGAPAAGFARLLGVEDSAPVHCPLCRAPLSVGEVLDAGTVARPAELLFQFLCPRCAGRALARADDGRLATGEVEGGRFVPASEAPAPDLAVRAESGWLDSWLGGRYRRFPSKG